MLSGKPAELIATLGVYPPSGSPMITPVSTRWRGISVSRRVARGLLMQQMSQLNGLIIRFPTRDRGHPCDHVLRGQAAARRG